MLDNGPLDEPQAFLHVESALLLDVGPDGDMNSVKGHQRLSDNVQMPTRYGVERSGVESFGTANLAHVKRPPPLPIAIRRCFTRRTEHASIEGFARSSWTNTYFSIIRGT